jgi:hypothetical protein
MGSVKKEDEITQADLKKILFYDPTTGVFTWLIKTGRSKAGKVAGTVNMYGYLVITIRGFKFQASRLAWLYVYGVWPNTIDHINHNRTDNNIKNLRNVDCIENRKNVSLKKMNSSGFNGVRYEPKRKKWRAEINDMYRKVFIGRFDRIEDAIAARKAANVKYGYHENHGVPLPGHEHAGGNW